jgi:glycopeptide antibiotics resistance protein
MIVPMAIEIIQSWLTSGCFDYWDIFFSFVGILTVLIILKKDGKIKTNKELYGKR